MTVAAAKWRRLAATTIDMILVPALALVLVIVTGTVEHAEDFQDNTWMLEILLLAVASYIILNGELLRRHGQTLGKKLLGIRIVDVKTDARPALWKLICIRALFFPTLFLLPLFPLTLIPVIDQAWIFTRQNRCLHDLVSSTRVVMAD